VQTPPPGPRIYNLFPLLVGPVTRWRPHLERARRLGFDWVFVNSFHQSGFSASLYSVKDYYAIDARLVDPAAGPPHSQLQQVIATARELGLKLMMDLIINHTAIDSPLVHEHPNWYKHDETGEPVRPGVRDGERWVVWGDLAEIDNAASRDRDALWRFWLRLAETYAALGFYGFRCDAAYKVPAELWTFLIARAKASHPGVLFFAESLGCPFEDTVKLARAGFDFLFNSSKWWDFSAPWCLAQYRESAPLAPSVSFPETHDTERLATELEGDMAAVKMRYAFAALYSTGVMMPIGFEFGFRGRLDVVRTRPEDWEPAHWDLSDFILRVNRLKESHRVFNEEGPIEPVDTGNPMVFALVKSSLDLRERAFVVLNKDRRGPQSFATARAARFLDGASRLADVSPEGRLEHTPDFQVCSLKPSGIHVLLAHAA
jgi:starch synthase (maltosyl-transferring)